MPELTLAEVARIAEGEVISGGERVLSGVAPLDEAGPEHLSFVANARYFPYIHTTRAGGVLVPRGAALELPEGLAAIRVADPHAALARILPVLYPERLPAPGVHPTAVVEAGAEVGEGASVGAYAVIGAGSRIGPRARVGAHVSVGRDCVVGADSVLHPHCTLYDDVHLGERCLIHSGARLGPDGFGFVFEKGGHRKVPQVGGVRVGDDVEVGANAAIDRGSVGHTVIGRGTKIDNLVHVGHNCRIGEHVLLVAQAGIAGSTRIGDGAVLAGQSGVGGHLTVGAGARVGGQAGVTTDVPAGQTVSGYPARPHREALRVQAATFKLPELMERVKRLERAAGGE